MFLSDFSIKRPVAMVVIIIALMCIGLLALKKLRVNQIPDVEQPVLVVNIPYPGASPETVEREIINRIEKPLQAISGMDRTQATASEGNAPVGRDGGPPRADPRGCPRRAGRRTPGRAVGGHRGRGRRSTRWLCGRTASTVPGTTPAPPSD